MAASKTTGPTLSSRDLEPRRKKLLFRAWHRGIKEMDIILGTFADAHLPTMSDDDLATFESLMDVPDRELFKWISGEAETPPNHRSGLLDRIVSFHAS
ncbi:MAG: succinate dehydrogenase assembly factor 2 [Pseudomonadota bacterium]